MTAATHAATKVIIHLEFVAEHHLPQGMEKLQKKFIRNRNESEKMEFTKL
jgi:hypothetical protein